MHYLITPFGDSTDEFIVGCREAFSAKYGDASKNKHKEANQQVVVTAAPGCLAGLQPTDVLYVVGHGSADGQSLMADPNGAKKLGPNDVADLLGEAQWGLGRNHRRVKLLCCYGGGKLRGNALDPDASAGFFAEVLAKAMGKRSYRDILVGGYPNPIYAHLSTHGVKVAFDEPLLEGGGAVEALIAYAKAPPLVQGSHQKVLPGKRYVRWFDADGRDVTRRVSGGGTATTRTAALTLGPKGNK